MQHSPATTASLRVANLKLLQSLTAEEWDMFGVHAERGIESLRDIAMYFAGHDINHFWQIESIRRRLGKATLESGAAEQAAEAALMTKLKTEPRVTSFAPQFLVEDLARSIAYYQKFGFAFGEPWDGFYAIGQVDGLEIHLKEAPKNEAERQQRREREHLDAAAGVDGIEAFYEKCAANGATILRPLAATAWGTKDFYVEDPDGYIISFGGRPKSE